MNAPLHIDASALVHEAEPLAETGAVRLREIPYNYTSFSDR